MKIEPPFLQIVDYDNDTNKGIRADENWCCHHAGHLLLPSCSIIIQRKYNGALLQNNLNRGKGSGFDTADTVGFVGLNTLNGLLSKRAIDFIKGIIGMP